MRESGVRSGELGVGSWESGVGSWESGVGSWESGVGSGETWLAAQPLAASQSQSPVRFRSQRSITHYLLPDLTRFPRTTIQRQPFTGRTVAKDRPEKESRIGRPFPAGPVPAEGGLATTTASSQTVCHRHGAGGEMGRPFFGDP